MDATINIINAYFAAITALDVEQWVATFAPDGTSYEPGNPPLTGHDALRQFFNGIAAGFESIEMKPDQSSRSAMKPPSNGRRVAKGATVAQSRLKALTCL